MATKEYVQERINSTKTKIEKSLAIIAKKTKLLNAKKEVLAQIVSEDKRYWGEYDIKCLERDITSKEKELHRELEPNLKKWENELVKIQQTVRDIPALVEFLNYWKQKVAEYYREERNSEDRRKMRIAIKESYRVYELQHQKIYFGGGTSEEREIINKLWKDYDKKRIEYESRFKMINLWESKGNFEEEMEKDLQREWEQKYDRLVADVTKITGTIEDCRGLSVSGRGELNGIVVGKEGKASITTFVAGGWNIQCAHYRCRITAVK